jgi:hypothetical protein
MAFILGYGGRPPKESHRIPIFFVAISHPGLAFYLHSKDRCCQAPLGIFLEFPHKAGKNSKSYKKELDNSATFIIYVLLKL